MHVQVKPGEWIRVPVPEDPWPVTMSIGDTPLVPAFIEHEANGQTLVCRRCPELPPKRYKFRVGFKGGEVTGTVTVTR